MDLRPPALSLVSDDRPRPHPRVKLLLERALDPETHEWVHVDNAVRRVDYQCPVPSCGGPVRLRSGSSRRPHFAHARSSSCINPSSIHRFSIQWICELGWVGLQASGQPWTNLFQPPPSSTIFDGNASAEYRLPLEDGRSLYRADVWIVNEIDKQVLAVEIENTHPMTDQKRSAYDRSAAVLAASGWGLSLLRIHLSLEQSHFYRRSASEWRDWVLLDAPRDLIMVADVAKASLHKHAQVELVTPMQRLKRRVNAVADCPAAGGGNPPPFVWARVPSWTVATKRLSQGLGQTV